VIEINEPEYGRRWLLAEDSPDLLFTENDSNAARLYGSLNASPHLKDSINDCLLHDRKNAVNADAKGTKAAAHYHLRVEAGETVAVRLRLTNSSAVSAVFDDGFDEIFEERRREADEFYSTVIPQDLSDDAKKVMRQSFAGLLWSKQFYHYVVNEWLSGDPGNPQPPEGRKHGRNNEWGHLYNADVISMPDKWEYPWYAAWDLAFHCVPLALVDSEFAKEQLALMVREWYMHPNGQLPAYEWAFGDVNRRCTPGRAARLQDREETPRRGRSPVPAARLSQAAAEFHLVGEPEGCRGPQHFPRRISRPR